MQQQPAVAPAESQEVNVCARTKTLRRSGIHGSVQNKIKLKGNVLKQIDLVCV